jgi:DNA segregation ATPase FtsK/SpoIIIE-like protein
MVEAQATATAIVAGVAAEEAVKTTQQQAEIERAQADQWASIQRDWVAPAQGALSFSLPAAGAALTWVLVASLGALAIGGVALLLYHGALTVSTPLVAPDRHGLLPVDRRQLGGLTGVAIGLLERHQEQTGAAALAGAQRPVLPQHYAPHITITNKGGETPPAPALPVPEAPGLPGVVDLGAVVQRASLDNILLALGPGGAPITVKATQLCHVALAGATGGGKSNLMRLLLAQLLSPSGADGKALARVVMCDPHFAPFDVESGDDWRPIAARLHMAPAITPSAIDDTLRWLAFDELPRRLELRRQGQKVGPPIFLAIDELPAIVEDTPKAPEYMGRVLREGRKVGLFIIGAAQDWLTKTVGGAGAIRDCYRTSYYVGGDTTSARVLLDITGRVDDGSLGQGLAMLRSAATPQAQTVRVPYASNSAITQLLPWVVQGGTEVVFEPEMGGSAGGTESVIDGTARTSPRTTFVPSSEPAQLDARTARILQMMAAQCSQNQIIREVFGVEGKGAAWNKAADELRAIQAEIARRAVGGAL